MYDKAKARACDQTRQLLPGRVASKRFHRAAYRARNRAMISEIRDNRAANNRAFILDYLSVRQCVDYGWDDIDVLEFDHRDPKTKLFALSDGYRQTLKALKAEIEKCDVRCANCHRKRHAIERRAGIRHGNPAQATPQLALF
jgi:hypothetical protein